MDYKQVSNLELMDNIRKGDQAAFQELFHRFYQLLLGVAINLLGDINTAKDIVQDVFIHIWNKRASIKIHTAVEPFLKRSVINRAINYIKAKRETVPEIHIQHLHNPDDVIGQLAADDLQEAIEQALATLPDRCRMIYVLKRIEGFSQKEIAEQLNISTKTVENQITKALKVLKTAVQLYLDQNNPPSG